MKHFKAYPLLVLLLNVFMSAIAQDSSKFSNSAFLKYLYTEKVYTNLKEKTISEFRNSPPGRWGEFVKGVDEKIVTPQKIVAFTFDACGGKKGDGFDKELIDYLQNEQIPATLFITGRWIDSHFSEFLLLSRNNLFEIENHGLNHRPCSVNGSKAYKIAGTADLEDAFDEIEANVCKIKMLTNRYPHFYRSATAYIDEASAAMASSLDITTISYDVLSGDAVTSASAKEIKANVLRNVKPGAIIIMHLNHPEGNTFEAMKEIVPALRKSGYKFALLKDFRETNDAAKKEHISGKK
jgi:peptidoglycan/xylan/chitin deacetylase (PgdA/CDA1 family)